MNIFTDIYNTIFADGTYKTILDGLFATLRISIFALIFAVILGFILLLLRRSKNVVLSTFAKVYIALVRGMPVLMLLMMMYYVVFARSTISAEFVAVITFALNTAAYIAELLRSSIDALDVGEVDAARTLGFNSTKAFFYITVPQCIKVAKPVFESTIINMIQWTSVVGYVTITDLTRIINQVSARTMKPTMLILIGMALYLLIAYIVKAIFYISDIIQSKRNTIIETLDDVSYDLYNDKYDTNNIPLEMKDIYKSFGSQKIYQGLNFSIHNGEVVSIIGPSGGGKSVMLKLAVALLPVDSGSIKINGQSITDKKVDIDTIRRKVGFVYQSFNLFSHLDILENLMLAPTIILKEDKKKTKEKAKVLLNMFGLLSSAHKMPSELSGGQKQRIAIARCLMMNPNLLLMDEPTSALDPSMTGEVLATIRMLKKYGITMIVVTHEMNFAKNISDRVCFIEEHQIYEEGSPKEIFENPKKPKTVAFIKKLKNFEYHIEDKDFDLYELKGKLSAFTDRYGIDITTSRRIEMIIEELVYEILNNVSGTKINVVVEYSDADSSIDIFVYYTGVSHDIFKEDDMSEEHLGLLIIKKSCKTYEDTYENGVNVVKIKL